MSIHPDLCTPDLCTDDERDAFQLHHSGLTWTQVARELGCTEGTAQAFATAYQQRTDEHAAQTQISLFSQTPDGHSLATCTRHRQ